MKKVAKCVRTELVRFGNVKAEMGDEPEAGSLRFKLWLHDGSTAPEATIYLDGDQKFAAVWMDAQSPNLGDRIWRRVGTSCRLH